MPANPNVEGAWGGRANRHKKCEEGRQKLGHDVSKSPTVPAEASRDSAIPERSATGHNYIPINQD